MKKPERIKTPRKLHERYSQGWNEACEVWEEWWVEWIEEHEDKSN